MFISPTFDHHLDWSWEFGARGDCKDVRTAMTMIYESSWMLPFLADDVANTLWIQTRMVMGLTSHVEWIDLHQDSSSLVTQFVSRSVEPGCDMAKCGQLATRCEPLGDKTLLLSTVHAQAPDPSAEIAAYKSDMWTLVQPVRKTPVGSLTRVLWHRRVRIQPPDTVPKTGVQGAEWVQRIVTSSLREREERLLMTNIQAVENILVDASRRRNGGLP